MAHASMISPSPTARRSAHEWLAEEHALYVEALELFPDSQWKVIAAYVGTRTTRQVMTHAHKIAQKKKRHERGLRPSGRPHGDATTRRTPRRTAKPTSVKILDETLDDDAKSSSPSCPTTAHFLDMFEFDALLDLDSADHELLWTDQPSKSPTSPAGSIFTSSVFGERVGGLDVDNVDWESFFRTL